MLPLILIVVGTLAIVALIIGITSCTGKPSKDTSVPAIAQPVTPSVAPNSPTVIAPTTTQTPDASSDVNALEEPLNANSTDLTPTTGNKLATNMAAARPTAEPGGYLPIFSKAKTEEKIIAITVDDCNQTVNLDQIIDCAVANDSKLTIFPIGKNLHRVGLQEVIRKAHALGMELENHSYSHSTFYRLDAAEMAKEIYNQNRVVSLTLGVNYQMHFMRTRGGDNRRDLRTHQYMEKMGYYGMSHWNVSGGLGIDKLKSSLAPGNVYLFHTTDSDLSKLLEFIPYAVSQGYQLVTLNEMFGYPDNEITEVTTPIEKLEVIEPDPYVYEYKTLKTGDYLWDVYLLQDRLIKLGWLDDKPDGVYGKKAYSAVGYFQLAVDIKPTGEATPETQEALFADTAPKSKNGKKAIGTPAQSSAPVATLDPNAPVPTTAPRATAPPVEVDMTLFD